MNGEVVLILILKIDVGSVSNGLVNLLTSENYEEPIEDPE